MYGLQTCILVTATCLALLPVSAHAVGNCSLVEPILVYQGSVGYLMHPLHLEAFPAYNDRRATAVSFKWIPKVIMERNRTTHDINGVPLPAPSCSLPNGLLEDPFLDDPSIGCNDKVPFPCGSIVQQIPFDDMDCTVSQGEDVFHGVGRRFLTIFFTHPLFPQLSVVFNAALVNDSVTVFPFDDPTHPNAMKHEYKYVPFQSLQLL